jgi:hypothetical protein
VNDFDDLDTLERELGPSLRLALRRAAEQITEQPPGAPRLNRSVTEVPAPLIEDAAPPAGAGDAQVEVKVVDFEPARRERTARRRLLVVAAAAVAVAVAAVTVLVERTRDDGIRSRVPAGPGQSVTTVPTPPTSAFSDPGFDALMRSQGQAPSTPKRGELVASAWHGGDLGAYYLYADGRLIWLDDVTDTPGWVEQRLTSEAVERIRTEFLSSGLFEARREVTNCNVLPVLCVRDDGRLFGRSVVPVTPEEQSLVDHLRALPLSVLSTDSADQQIKEYVPAKYAVCFEAALPRGPLTVPPDPSVALKALPARAARLLRGHRVTRQIMGGPGTSCFEVSTGSARVVATEVVNAFGTQRLTLGRTKSSFEIEASANRSNPKRFSIGFQQLLPDGGIAFYYPKLA